MIFSSGLVTFERERHLIGIQDVVAQRPQAMRIIVDRYEHQASQEISDGCYQSDEQ